MVEGAEDLPTGIHLWIFGDVVGKIVEGRGTNSALLGHGIPFEIMGSFHSPDKPAKVLDERCVVTCEFDCHFWVPLFSRAVLLQSCCRVGKWQPTNIDSNISIHRAIW